MVRTRSSIVYLNLKLENVNILIGLAPGVTEK